MALAALGAAAVLELGSATAEAAPSVSRFAGTYVGSDPAGWSKVSPFTPFTVTITDGGRISAVRPDFAKDKISGQVGADGRYAVSVIVTILSSFERPGRKNEAGEGYWWRTVDYKSSGTLATDEYGNVVGTDDAGESFVWVRQ
jgi:hypothetical protein